MANQALAYEAALQFYLDHGVDGALMEEPVNHLAVAPVVSAAPAAVMPHAQPTGFSSPPQKQIQPSAAPSPVSKELATQANSLEKLKDTLSAFDGLPVTKTATNMVFADGHSNARVMVIGEAPGADEDRQGVPFVGAGGLLLDKILACIGLDRTKDTPEEAVYLSNILNWRPPGNRTPTPIEIEACLPFIEKHIALIKPDFLILCGGLTAKSLLNSDLSLSKLRGKMHNYVPQSIDGEAPIPAIVTYHPLHLLQTPAQKKAVWQDMLRLQEQLTAKK